MRFAGSGTAASGLGSCDVGAAVGVWWECVGSVDVGRVVLVWLW